MSGFDNETLIANNVNFSGTTTEPSVTQNGQLLIGSDDAPNIRVAKLTAGTNVSIVNGPGTITISASGGSSSNATNLAVDDDTPPGTNPVVPDGGDVITLTGGQVANGVIGTNVIQTNSTAANTVTIEIQQAGTSAMAAASENGVSHFNSSHFTLGANAFVSLTATVPTTFNSDSGSATPAGNAISILGGEGIDTSATGSTITISGEDATTTNKGIASFEAADFDITGGAVSLEDTVVKSVVTDSGTATPSVHSFSIVGTGSVSTSATGSTVTITGTGASTITGDTGGALPTTAGNWNILGGEGIDTSGTGSTLTISGEDASDTNKGIASFASADFNVTAGAVELEDTVVKSVASDSGTVTPVGHSFTVTGATGLTTSGATDTLTISLDGGVVGQTITGDTGGALSPTAGNWNILGGEGIDTSGTGSTLTIAGEDASTTNKGIASFASADFNVTAGAVELEDTVVKSVASDSGTVTPSGHSFTVTGDSFISTSGSGSTLTISADYATGTWTPAITATGSNPTVTYFTQLGKYTRIGDVIFIKARLHINTISGGSGQVTINTPFASDSDSIFQSGSVRLNNTTLTGAYSVPGINQGTNVLRMYEPISGSTQAVMQVSALTNGSDIVITHNYWV